MRWASRFLSFYFLHQLPFLVECREAERAISGHFRAKVHQFFAGHRSATCDRRPHAAAVKFARVSRLNASSFHKGGENVHCRHNLRHFLAWLQLPGPTHHRNDANTALKGLALSAAQWGIVRSAKRVGRTAVVAEKQDNGVIGNTLSTQGSENLADGLVHGIHHCRVHRPGTFPERKSGRATGSVRLFGPGRRKVRVDVLVFILQFLRCIQGRMRRQKGQANKGHPPSLVAPIIFQTFLEVMGVPFLLK